MAYSIFWWAGVSRHSFFQHLELEPELEVQLKNTLLKYKNLRQSNFINYLESEPNFPSFLYFMITAESFTDETNNVLFARTLNGAHRLYIDQFFFGLIKDAENAENLFITAGNMGIDDCEIILFSKELWHENIVQPVIDLLEESRNSNSV